MTASDRSTIAYVAGRLVRRFIRVSQPHSIADTIPRASSLLLGRRKKSISFHILPRSLPNETQNAMKWRHNVAQ